MEAKLRQHGEIAIVSIHGLLDIEKTQPFRAICAKHFLGDRVIFNLEEANFVGSTGIQPFIDAIRVISSRALMGVKLVGLKSEFKRIFSNLEIQGLEIHDSESGAISSFYLPKPPTDPLPISD